MLPCVGKPKGVAERVHVIHESHCLAKLDSGVDRDMFLSGEQDARLVSTIDELGHLAPTNDKFIEVQRDLHLSQFPVQAPPTHPKAP
jgi:hypothetical protein